MIITHLSKEHLSMRVRLTLHTRDRKRVVEALPALIEAGAIEPTIRDSKKDDGPFELQFRLVDGQSIERTLAIAGLEDMAPYARTA